MRSARDLIVASAAMFSLAYPVMLIAYGIGELVG